MPGVAFAATGEASAPMICRQCEDPPCVVACPFEALRREDDGAVVRSLVLCRGCGSCVLACPFGVLPDELTQHVVAKCDLCEDLTASGGRPRCVAACPAGALQFVEPDEFAKKDLMLIGGRAAGRNPFRRR